MLAASAGLSRDPGAILGDADGEGRGTYTPARYVPLSAPRCRHRLSRSDRSSRAATGAEPEFRARLRRLLTPLPSLCPSYGPRELSLVRQPEVTMGRESGRPGHGLGPRDVRTRPLPRATVPVPGWKRPLLSAKAHHRLSSRSQLSY